MNTKTTAERQAIYRASKAAQNLTEVRGIYALPSMHAAIRAAAAKIIKRPVQKGVQ